MFEKWEVFNLGPSCFFANLMLSRERVASVLLENLKSQIGIFALETNKQTNRKTKQKVARDNELFNLFSKCACVNSNFFLFLYQHAPARTVWKITSLQ